MAEEIELLGVTKKPEKKKPKEPKEVVAIKTTVDAQRFHLEKLMKNIDKPVVIPEPRKDKKDINKTPDFVRNVMGSSAGAGSGEFHVYRHLRRKEYARQKALDEISEKEALDIAFEEKLEANKRLAEERTAKKRAKRLKKKANKKQKTAGDQKVDNTNKQEERTSEEKNNSSEDSG